MKNFIFVATSFFVLSTLDVSARVVANDAQRAAQNGASTALPIHDPDLTQFAAAVQAAGVYDLFVGTGPFTAFAPSNAAFDKLGKQKMDELLKPENKDRLTEILLYHVIPGKYIANTIKTENVKTINGKALKLANSNGEVTVNGAKIVKADLVGSNGVIHIIDTVLVP